MKFFPVEDDMHPNLGRCLLRVLVPTLNRPRIAVRNVEYLSQFFTDCPCSIQIVCSENGADEKHNILSEHFSHLDNVVFIRRKTRLSLGAHMHWLSSLGGAKWHLWCGDDDILDLNYINWISKNLESIKEQGIQPDNRSITEAESFTVLDSRLKILGAKYSPEGLIETEENVFPRKVVMRATQLSGLLLLADVEKEVYRNGKMPVDNIYPWVGFFTHALNRGRVKMLKNCPSLITNDTEKLFSYNKNGLLNEIAEAVYYGNHSCRSGRKRFVREVLSARACHWRLFKTNPSRLRALLNYRFVLYRARGWRMSALVCFPSVVRTYIKYNLATLKNAVFK